MSFKLERACPLRGEARSAIEDGGFCSTCQKTVHNLAELDEAETEALFGNPEQPACGSVAVNTRGQVRFRTGWSARVLLGLGLATAAACDTNEQSTHNPSEGEVIYHRTAGVMVSVPVEETRIPNPCAVAEDEPLPEVCQPEATPREEQDETSESPETRVPDPSDP
jgi:hypothetical protein